MTAYIYSVCVHRTVRSLRKTTPFHLRPVLVSKLLQLGHQLDNDHLGPIPFGKPTGVPSSPTTPSPIRRSEKQKPAPTGSPRPTPYCSRTCGQRTLRLQSRVVRLVGHSADAHSRLEVLAPVIRGILARCLLFLALLVASTTSAKPGDPGVRLVATRVYCTYSM